MNDPVDIGPERIFYPTDRFKHWQYRFFLKVSSKGGSVGMFGPYDLVVGCLYNYLEFGDNVKFVENVSLKVGDDKEYVYTFYPPDINLSWCNILKNEIADVDGKVIKEDVAKVVPSENCTADPCWTFDLVSTDLPDYIIFKVLTTVDNDVTHLSPEISISLADIFIFTSTTVEVEEAKVKAIQIEAAQAAGNPFQETQLIAAPLE